MPIKPPTPTRPAPAKKRALSPRGRGSVAPKRPDDLLLALFAENVRRVRLRKGVTQSAMADAADIDRTYASGIERAQRNVSIRNIQRVADALEVDVRVLFDPALAEHPLWGGDLPSKVGSDTTSDGSALLHKRPAGPSGR